MRRNFWICTLPWIIFALSTLAIFRHIIWLDALRIAPDSDGYLEVAKQILNQQLPFLGVRPPGYPLFLILIKAITGAVSLENPFVVIFQNILAVLSGFVLVYAASRWNKKLILPATLVVYICWFNSHDVHIFNAYLLSDSLFNSLLLIFIALMTLCLHPNNKIISWFLLSLTLGFAIWVKPAAQFFLPCFAMIFLYLIFSKSFRSFRKILAYCLPVIVLLSIFLFYNFFVSGFLGLSVFGGPNLIGATCYGLAFTKDIPNEIQPLVKKLQTHLQEKNATEILKTSWSRIELNRIYEEAHDWCVYQNFLPYYSNKYDNLPIAERWIHANRDLTRLSLFSIRHQPKIYFKFVITQFKNYFSFIFFRQHSGFLWLISAIFFIWITLHSLWLFITSKGKNNLAFLLLCFFVLILSYGLLISLIEVMIPRYMIGIRVLPYFMMVLYFAFWNCKKYTIH